jgi:hypothetical protein
MLRLFRRGEELIDKEMDMVKIIKAIRNLKVVLKSRLIDKATMFQIKNSGKNIINIDKESDEDSSDSSEIDDFGKRQPSRTIIKREPVQMAKIE